MSHRASTPPVGRVRPPRTGRRLRGPAVLLGVIVTVALTAGAPARAASTSPDAGSHPASPPVAAAAPPIGPTTGLRYAPNGNFTRSGSYLPGAAGFDLADVSSVGEVDDLPPGDRALVYVGLCGGADAEFTGDVRPFVGNPVVYGFYLMDEPDPTGRYAPLCPAPDLKAEADWIHAADPGAVTFIVLMNLGTPTAPDYLDTYNSASTDIDYFGLDPYPCINELHGCNDSVIGDAVGAAEAAGIAVDQMVPVFQAFGGGGYRQWTLPKVDQELQLLAAWKALTPTPAFDVAYVGRPGP